MHMIQSEQLKVTIASKGAELTSIYHKQHALEYMWDANPAFWAKTSPVLFPIVGTLKNNMYHHQGNGYTMPRHGFARDKEFVVEEHSPNSIKLSISHDADTQTQYPFQFKFSILYTVNENNLSVAYQVENQGNEPLLFSVGGHPAFKVPLVKDTSYDDYSLQFEKEETAGRWPITKEGLIDETPQPLLQNTKQLLLTKTLFQKDAIVLKHLQSTAVKLVSEKTPHGLSFQFKGFPYLGLWAAPGADFLCIEPWCGIADSITTNQQLANKEGIQQLPVGNAFTVSWKVTCF